MTGIIQKMSLYFYSAAQWLGNLSDRLYLAFDAYLNSEILKSYIDRTEEWVQSILPEDKSRLGLVALISGLILLFAILAHHLFSWIVLILMLVGSGILIFQIDNNKNT